MSHVATDTNWAVSEFADAELGDERRTKRLVRLSLRIDTI
jgi:transposase-like protein